MHPEQRPTEHSPEEYPQYPPPEGYPPYQPGYPVAPEHQVGQGPQAGYPAPEAYPHAPAGPAAAGGYEGGYDPTAGQPTPGGYPPHPYGQPDAGYPAGGSGPGAGYPPPAGEATMAGGYPTGPLPPYDPGQPAGEATMAGGYPTGQYPTGQYQPYQTGQFPPGEPFPTGQYQTAGGYGFPETGEQTQAGGYPYTGEYPAAGTPAAGAPTGSRPPAPSGPPTGAFRPTGELPPTGQVQPTGEYAKFKEGQAAAGAAAAGTGVGRAAARAERAKGKQSANKRLRISAAVILAATLMVGGGAYAAQGNGSQPFAGLLAGDRETTTSAPAAAATPEPTQAPKSTQPPTTAAPTTTAPPETTAAPEPEEEAEAPASNRARAGVRPTAENTGVPPGVDLKPHSGELNISEAGTTISGLDIDGCVGIGADNVTIRNSRIRCGGSYPVKIMDGATGVLLEDIEINGGGNPEAIAIADSNYTVRRANIHNVGDGPRLGDNTTVEFSFIHDLVAGGGSHNDGAQSTGGSNIVVRGNTIDNQNSQTAAILIGADLGNISDAVVEGNWLNGGGYTVYAGADEGFDHSGIRIVDNVFGRDHAHGPMQIQDGVAWEGNRYADGEAITR